jgi:hypothetical protein
MLKGVSSVEEEVRLWRWGDGAVQVDLMSGVKSETRMSQCSAVVVIAFVASMYQARQVVWTTKNTRGGGRVISLGGVCGLHFEEGIEKIIGYQGYAVHQRGIKVHAYSIYTYNYPI